MSVRNALRKVIPLRASTFEKARKRLEASNVATAEKICLLEAKSAEIATKLDHLDATFDERVTSMVTQEATSALVAAKLDQVITRFDKIAEDIANLNSSVHASKTRPSIRSLKRIKFRKKFSGLKRSTEPYREVSGSKTYP